MIIYAILSAIVFVLAALFDPLPEVTTFFGLENYVASFSGTIQHLGVIFPPISTLSTCIAILMGLMLSMQGYKILMRIIRILRG